MLLITVETDPALVTLRLEGQLYGAGVGELSKTCDMAAQQRRGRPLSIDVTGVVGMDRRGREFLADVHQRGIHVTRDGQAPGVSRL